MGHTKVPLTLECPVCDWRTTHLPPKRESAIEFELLQHCPSCGHDSLSLRLATRGEIMRTRLEHFLAHEQCATPLESGEAH